MNEIQNNVAKALQKAKQDQNKTLEEFAEELNISRTAMRQYLQGTANPTADTLTVIAAKLEMSPAELISGLPSGVTQAEFICRVAREISTLAPCRREECIRIFIALVELFSQQSKAEHPDDSI